MGEKCHEINYLSKKRELFGGGFQCVQFFFTVCSLATTSTPCSGEPTMAPAFFTSRFRLKVSLSLLLPPQHVIPKKRTLAITDW